MTSTTLPERNALTAELEKLAELVDRHNLFVLCDEAYFDIRYEGQSRSFAALPGMASRCVILYTFSKRFAMTGWRLGATIGPKEIIDVIIRLNVNDESCSNHFIQYAAIEGLTGDQTETRQMLAILGRKAGYSGGNIEFYRRGALLQAPGDILSLSECHWSYAEEWVLTATMIFAWPCCTKRVYRYAPAPTSAGRSATKRIDTFVWPMPASIRRKLKKVSENSRPLPRDDRAILKSL